MLLVLSTARLGEVVTDGRISNPEDPVRCLVSAELHPHPLLYFLIGESAARASCSQKTGDHLAILFV